MLSRLVEVLLLQWLRHQLDRMRGGSGSLLAGLSDPALRPVLDAIHRQPEHAWSLAELARLAVCRAPRWPSALPCVVGQPPGDYLLDWRLRRARLLLREAQAWPTATAVGWRLGRGTDPHLQPAPGAGSGALAAGADRPLQGVSTVTRND